MKNQLLATFLSLSLALCHIAATAADSATAPQLDLARVRILGATDCNPVEYAAGDTMTFTFTVDTDGQPVGDDWTIAWTRSGDDGKFEKGEARVADGPVVVATSLDSPGFVRLQAWLRGGDGKSLDKSRRALRFDGGAGAGVADIRQAVPEPDDFDEFWKRQKEKLAEVPLTFTMEKLADHNDNDRYAVTVACAGPRPVTGYLTVPRGAAEKSLPARVMFQGYGVPNSWLQGGSRTEIQFNINAHGVELGRDHEFYKAFEESIKSNGHGYALDPRQNADPEAAYFNGMALRVMRALEFVKQRPEWNGRDLVTSGGSQGGLQSVWAAALDHDVSLCENTVTWCCDMAGHAEGGRLAGWCPQWVPALGYYDAVNHARRIRSRFVVTRAGLGDYVCPPSGIAALYNAVTAPKKIVWMQDSDHGYQPRDPATFTQETE